MKNNLYLILFIFLFVVSCKKDSAPSSEVITSEMLIQKYNLKAVDNSVDNSAKAKQNFETLKQLDNYLKMHSSVISDSTTVFVDTLKSTSKSTPDAKLGVNYTEAPITTPAGTYYSATLNFPGLNNSGYPGIVILNWDNNGSNVTSTLVQTGPSAGAWSYTQLFGSSFNHQMLVNGLYTEVFGVAGIYTYTRNYRFTLSGTWDYPPVLGRIGATATYTPL